MTARIQAPPARLVNALDGKKAPKKYFDALSEADNFVAERDDLAEENARLRHRVDELDGIAGVLLEEKAALKAERDELAEQLQALDDAHQVTLARLAEARRGKTEPWHGQAVTR